MSAQASPRALARAALIERLARQAELAGVQVERGIPVEWGHEHVVLGNITGTMSLRHMQAGRKSRSDEFTIAVYIMAGKPGQTVEQAEARAIEMLAALDDVLAADPLLGRVPGLQRAHLGQVDGPDVAATNEGQVAFVAADVECLAYLV